ncbi:MAG TPA: terminase small subunit [Ruminococcaceae bacterium]|nr:terminase small subunit [Oscillospiraceae bacterium]
MNAKQKKFCDEYLVDCNAAQAAIRAGYSPKTAKQIGQENLTKPDLRAYIDEQLLRLHNDRTADAAEVMEYLTAVMRGESTAHVVVVEGIGEGCSEAKVIQKPPDEKERLKAAELLGKRFGLFTEKIDVSGNIPVVISGDDKIAE